jgi:hypothetical protein
MEFENKMAAQLPSLQVTAGDAPPAPPSVGVYTLAGGMWLAMSAFLAQIQSVQNYDSEGLIPLSADIQEDAETQANYWINVLSGGQVPNPIPASPDPHTMPGQFSDAYIIAWDIAHGGSNTAALIQADTATMSVHNTLYNQASNYFSGLNNTVNQNSANATQTIQIALQEYAQGPQSILQTVASII